MSVQFKGQNFREMCLDNTFFHHFLLWILFWSQFVDGFSHFCVIFPFTTSSLMIIIIIAIKTSILERERDDISLQFGRGGYTSSGSCFHFQNHRTSNASLDDAGIHHDLGCIHSLTLTTRSDNDERTRRDRRNFPVQDNLTHNRQSCNSR